MAITRSQPEHTKAVTRPSEHEGTVARAKPEPTPPKDRFLEANRPVVYNPNKPVEYGSAGHLSKHAKAWFEKAHAEAQAKSKPAVPQVATAEAPKTAEAPTPAVKPRHARVHHQSKEKPAPTVAKKNPEQPKQTQAPDPKPQVDGQNQAPEQRTPNQSSPNQTSSQSGEVCKEEPQGSGF